MSTENTFVKIKGFIDFDKAGNIIIVNKNPSEYKSCETVLQENNNHKFTNNIKYSSDIIEATKLEDETFLGPYECPICHNYYVKKSYWKQHIKSHETKFECTICKHKFTHHHHLNQHMIIHEKEKRYACEVCGQKIRFKFNMKKHMKTHIKYFDHDTKTFKYLK